MNCRFCKTQLRHEFLDLGHAPPSNAFLTSAQLAEPESYYPLKLWICDQCLLVQLDEYKRHEEIFRDDYAYFSSYSSSWLAHAQAYVEMIAAKLRLGKHSQVIEIASNDGYLLQYVQAQEIPCLGIEPSSNTAHACREKGIPVREDFFGVRLAETLPKADLLLGNNVLAHVPDLHDFVEGLRIALKPHGTITLEFPHVLRLIEQHQFDTVYHEHFSYFSLFTVQKILVAHGLKLYDVEELPTHGGSLRIYAAHAEHRDLPVSQQIQRVLAQEEHFGLHALTGYHGFQEQVNAVKDGVLRFLLDAKQAGKCVVGYGAAAKGNTLLNYCGVKKDLLTCVVDKSPHKQGKFLPGSHIPVVSPAEICRVRPDYVLILPWNIQQEIMQELADIRAWGGQFVTAIPGLRIVS
jgi:hypothetical protein